MKNTFTRQEVIDLMRQSWWNGHETSRYCPNLNGSCYKDVRETLKEHEEPTEEQHNGC